MESKKVKEMLETIEAIIQVKVDPSNPEEIIGHLNEVCAIQSNASYCQAEAERLLSQRMMELVEKVEYRSMTATDKKFLFTGKCRDLTFLVTYSERLSRNLSHKIDGLRSMLSFLKAEMDRSAYQTH